MNVTDGAPVQKLAAKFLDDTFSDGGVFATLKPEEKTALTKECDRLAAIFHRG